MSLAVTEFLPPLMTVEEVAELARLGRSTVWDDIYSGVLPVVHPGGRRRTMVEAEVAMAYARGELHRERDDPGGSKPEGGRG